MSTLPSTQTAQDGVQCHTEGGICTLTLHRPDKKNAITAAMYTQLVAALNTAASEPSTRVVVVQGSTTVFCAGNDVSDFLHHPPIDSTAPVFRFLQALAQFAKPLIAAVCGPAVGVGTTLLLHCDLVYAGDNAVLSLPFVNLGLCPEAASSLLLPRRIGAARAAEMLMLGDPILAEAALEMGLINRVLAPSETANYAHSIAKRLAQKPGDALQTTKRLLRQDSAAAVQRALDQEAQEFARLLQEPAAKEAFSAFMQQRKPDFSSL